MKIAVIIYDGVELIDMNGPIDVFLHVNSIIEDRYQIYTVAESKTPIKSEGGIVTILPEYDFTDAPEPDVLIVPGLLDHNLAPTVASPANIAYIKETILKEKIVLSVCVGLFNLVETGLLSGKKVTTHYRAVELIQERHKDIHVVKNEKVVQDGKLFSTGGFTSGIDGALQLLEIFDGDSVAQEIANKFIYSRKAPLPEGTLLPL